MCAQRASASRRIGKGGPEAVKVDRDEQPRRTRPRDGDTGDGDGGEDEPGGRRVFLRRVAPLAGLLAGLVLFFVLDLDRYLQFETLAEHREWLSHQVTENYVLSVFAFILAYALAIAFSIPGGAILTITGGFLFGTWAATVYVVVGATAGAVAVFLAARTALGHWLSRRAGPAVQRMRAGFRKDALNYLLVLRLIPIFPFWLVNLVPALVGVPLKTYAIATVLGIVPGSLVYASVGNGLGAILDAGDTPDLGLVFRPEILLPIVGLAVLALLPVAYRHVRARRARGGD